MAGNPKLGRGRHIRQHTSPMRRLLAHQLGKKRPSVLVAELDGGLWASTHLHLGTTPNVQKLTLGMARRVKRLYEVDVSEHLMNFTSIFETDAEGAIVEGEIAVLWRITDPVGFIIRPSFDQVEAIRSQAEDILRPMVKRTTIASLDGLAEKADNALKGPNRLPAGPVEWGKADTYFRLTGIGALHKYSVEAIRRARIVDREQRGLDHERIEFYANVINSGRVNLLALWLSNDKANVDNVLRYIQDHEIATGRTPLDNQDPVRHVITQLINETDEFTMDQIRMAVVDNLRSSDPHDKLRQALNRYPPGTNGTGRPAG